MITQDVVTDYKVITVVLAMALCSVYHQGQRRTGLKLRVFYSILFIKLY